VKQPAAARRGPGPCHRRPGWRGRRYRAV